MSIHAHHPSGYIEQTQRFMQAMKSEIRAHANFQKLTGEVDAEHRKGPETQRHTLYRCRWELEGVNGSLVVDASFANDIGASLVTRLTLKPLGTASAQAVFGSDYPMNSTPENVIPTIKSWIDIITNASVDPFGSVRLPSPS